MVKLPDDEEPLCYEFSVPKAGTWWIMVRTRGMKNGWILSNVDEEFSLLPTQLMAERDRMTWTILAPGQKQGNRISFYELNPSEKHRIYLKKGNRTQDGFEIEGIAVTDNPEAFEPR